MGYQECRGAAFLQDMQSLVANLVTQPGIKAGKWLIQEHHPRVRRQGAGNRHPLLLAAGQRMGIGFRCIRHADLVQDLERPSPTFWLLRPRKPNITLSRTER